MKPTKLFTALLAAGLLTTLGMSSAPVQTAPSNQSINVQLTCTANAVTATVNPWSVEVSAGDSIAWVPSGVDSMRISMVPGNGWPFQGAPPMSRGNARAQSQARRPNLPQGVRRYFITAWCQPGDREVRIDPDIIIRPG